MAYLLYTQAAEHALKVHLEPVKSVIADLCGHGKSDIDPSDHHIHQADTIFALVPSWNSRLPPAPKKDQKNSHVLVKNTLDNAKPDRDARKIR